VSVRSTLEFASTPAVSTLAAVVLPLTIVLGVVALRRSEHRLRTAFLECLRTTIVALVLFALHQPELVTEDTSERTRRIVVLVDDTGSMATRDVFGAGDVVAAPRSRGDALSELLAAVDLAGHLATMEATGPGALTTRIELAVEHLTALTADPASDATPAGIDDSDATNASDGSGAADAPGATPVELGTPLGAALDRLLGRQDLAAVVVLGDGDWNTGPDPASVAMRYRMRDVPITTVGFGSRTALPDLALLPLEPPTFALVGKPLEVPFAIESSLERDVAVTVSLVDASGRESTREVLVAAGRVTESVLTTTPNDVGVIELRVTFPVQPGELDETNNVGTVAVDVREESLRVLIVESLPRWEYRYLRNAMVRDPGVTVDCVLFHPDIRASGGGPHYLPEFPSREALTDYDVVFLGDVGLAGADVEGLTLAQCEDLAGLVAEQASGLVLMPGFGGRMVSLMDTALGPLFPVELDRATPYGHGTPRPAALSLTEAGRDNALTRLALDPEENLALWESLPGFQWHAAVSSAVPGATVLAVHTERVGAAGRTPLLVTKPYRTGKVLFMGTDGAWRWREGVEDLVHYRYWRQVVRWMAYQRRMNAGESMRLFHVPDRPRARAVTTLYANVMDGVGSPLVDAHVSARIEAPSGRISKVDFAAEQGDWGLYRATFQPLEAGPHRVTLSCRETGATLAAEITVTGTALERVGRPARPDVLAELSRVTRGSALTPAESAADGPRGLRGLASRLAAEELAPTVTARIRIWSHPILGALVLSLMTLFWVLRKLAGRF
jgi:hypothetical protein